MTRFLTISLLAASLLATAPSTAVALSFDLPNLTYPPSKPVDTTRGCSSPATATDCTTQTK